MDIKGCGKVLKEQYLSPRENTWRISAAHFEDQWNLPNVCRENDGKHVFMQKLPNSSSLNSKIIDHPQNAKKEVVFCLCVAVYFGFSVAIFDTYGDCFLPKV